MDAGTQASSAETGRGGRVLPQNRDAEESLLAACILDAGQDVLTACVEANLKPESFYLPAHQIIYQVLLELYGSGKPVEEVTLFNALETRQLGSVRWLREKHRKLPEETPLIDLVGGRQVVAEITGRDMAPMLHARQWLELVREKWLLRRLIETASQIADDAYTSHDKLDVFIDRVEQQILGINEVRYADSVKPFSTAVDDASHLIEQILKGQNENGVMTGFQDVDAITFGLHPGQMVVLAARPSMGKTSFGMNIAENAALPLKGRGEPVPTLVFSLEMPAEQLAMRMLCGRARVNMNKVRNKFVSKEQLREISRVGKELKAAPIWVDDSSNLNILELRAKARRLHRKHNLRLIVVDYLQLIAGTDSRVPREQQISEISRGVKGMAKELGLPVLVLSQLNRSSEKENRQPRISDLRESGSIEQDADVVFLLATRQKSEDNAGIPQASHERDLIIAKQRNGPTGEVPLTFIPDFTRFENYSAPISE